MPLLVALWSRKVFENEVLSPISHINSNFPYEDPLKSLLKSSNLNQLMRRIPLHRFCWPTTSFKQTISTKSNLQSLIQLHPFCLSLFHLPNQLTSHRTSAPRVEIIGMKAYFHRHRRKAKPTTSHGCGCGFGCNPQSPFQQTAPACFRNDTNYPTCSHTALALWDGGKAYQTGRAHRLQSLNHYSTPVVYSSIIQPKIHTKALFFL